MWFTVMLFVLVILLLVYFILNYYPAFGGKPSEVTKRAMLRSANYEQGKFVNPIPTSMDMKPKEMFKVATQMIKGTPGARPSQAMPVVPLTPEGLIADGQPGITWFGHSALWLQLDGRTIFIDPMLGIAPSPFPDIGGKRYSKTLPIRVEDLPAIDVVLISHDHYDHLDYGTIKKLKSKVSQFIVPLGVAAHLVRWGVDASRIREAAWGDAFDFEGIRFTSAPARHFSGRGPGDRFKTLWCSWIIRGRQANLFVSGDSGYGPHFKEIGEKYGPFDLTLMECGQYNERWSAIHMMPEETVQAAIDVKAKLLIPIHWGAFTLALHTWNDPIIRAARASELHDMAIATPRIGETIRIGSEPVLTTAWWNTDGQS
jgi:L-ascorbate metabolism protein UlaG (beta-lactamase superfamily)